MATRESQKRAVANYDKKNTIGIYLKLNKTTDADIIEMLEQAENKQGLIKQLLREHTKKGNAAKNTRTRK